MKTILQSIGDYQILERLGRGGMADVYLALDTRTGRRIALKLVEHGAGPDAADIVAAERLGAQLQADLSAVDPRIPQINSFGDIDDFFCIDMEYVEGRDLSEVIREGPLEPHEAARIAAELCSILSVAHSTTLQVDGRELRAVVHGDIKPGNIRLDPEGRVRVLDFGIAKGLSLTRKLTSNVFGSVSYASPERLDSGRIDEMSDLWSVGVVLYEMLGGKPPFEAPSTEMLEKLVRSRALPQPLPDTAPLDLQQIAFKALAQSASRRYPSAREFEADLRAFITGTPTAAAAESEETRRTDVAAEHDMAELPPLPPGAAVGAETRRTASPPPAWLRRTRLGLLIGVPALVLVMLAWEGFVYRDANRFASVLESQQIDGDTAWQRYQDLKRRSPTGLSALVLKLPLEKLLYDQCSRTADDYSNSDTPHVREADWIRCKRQMQRALELYPGDRKAGAMMAYADGQILRINRKDSESLVAFQRAAVLQPKWPDPHLGMARVYIYAERDFDRGTQELEKAESLGHKPGKREQAQRADAFKNRGLQYMTGAAKLRGQQQEKDMLSRAKDDLENALSIYSEIAPWGDTTNQIRQVQEALDKVQLRLDQLDPPASIFSWRWWKKL
jgi:hypothetical protein